MKVLFYSNYHFNTETFGPYLEMMQTHLNAGDEVTFLTCNSELSSCQINPFHSKLVCQTCISTRKNGIACLNGKVKEISISAILKENEIDAHLDLINYSTIEDFRNVVFEKMDIGIAVLSSVVSIYRDPNPDLKAHASLIENQWSSAIWVYEAIKKEITTTSYDTVYVFNARFATLRACLRACEFKGVDCHVLEQGRNKSCYAIYPNVMPHSIEHVVNLIKESWVTGSKDKEQIAADYYIRRSQSKDERDGVYTESQEKGKLPEGWDITKTNIAIFNSSEDEYVAIGKEWENKLYKSQADAISKITNEFRDNDAYRFYVRVHPNLLGIFNESVTELYSLNNKNVTIIRADSNVSTYTLMFNANKVISFGSSVGIEAAAFEKISILAGQSFYRELGSTFNPENHEELIELVKAENLEPKSTEGALMYAYYLNKFGRDYNFFKRISPFEATLNNKKFGPSLPYLLIRKVGRWKRKRNEAKVKLENIEKLRKFRG